MKDMRTLRSSIRLRTLTSLALAGALAIPAPVFAAGRTPTPVLNTILSGKGAPKSSLGSNGDFYIDQKSFNFYGPKVKNRWPTPVSLKGPTGPAGTATLDSKTTKNPSGAVISNSASATGAKGDPGPVGPIGPIGPRGEKGEVGAQGLAGAPGAQGLPGAVGPAGANGFGSPGVTGATGATGAQGVQGIKGETGTAGPSSTSYGVITFANPINAPFTYQDSSAFGNFASGNSFIVDIYLRSTLADGGAPNLAVTFLASGGLRIVQSNYVITTGSSFRTGATKSETSAIAKLLVVVDSRINPKIMITATSSNASSGNVQTLTGYFTEQEVGAIL